MGIHENLVDAKWPVVEEFVEANDKWRLRSDRTGSIIWNGIAVRIGIAYGDVTDEVNSLTGRTDYRGHGLRTFRF
eukprot:gene56709-biopygen22882